MQRVFLIHGWGGSPENDWFPWTRRELEKMGFEVIIPEMPDTDHPKRGLWVNKLKETVGKIRSSDIFVGHSIGTLTILGYLETLDENQKIERVILVAPWHILTLDESENLTIAEPWIKTPIDYKKIKSKTNKIITVFSDNDPWVPMEQNLKYFKDKLNPNIIIKNKMGHFTADEGFTKIPFLLDLIN